MTHELLVALLVGAAGILIILIILLLFMLKSYNDSRDNAQGAIQTTIQAQSTSNELLKTFKTERVLMAERHARAKREWAKQMEELNKALREREEDIINLRSFIETNNIKEK